MKILIDIPDEQYEYIKKSDKNTFAAVSSKECMLYAIKNGTPIPTEGDLISRSALKKSFSGYTLFTADTVIEHIDTAPTVVACTPDEVKAIVETMVNLATKNVKENRPLGEWKRHDDWVNGIYVGGFYHVNCPNENGYYSRWTTNFCPNCGAIMKDGTE